MSSPTSAARRVNTPQVPETGAANTRQGVKFSDDEKAGLSSPPRKANVVEGKFLKIRIMTWNMHDSLPKGNLEELLGKVPSYSSANSGNGSFPKLSTDANHPYHLVVVAAQECPTQSRIPMGLGAGFKLIDKEKEREKDREEDQEKAKDAEREHEKHRSRSKNKDKDKDEGEDAAPSGWTSMVEDWLCHGSGCGIASGSPTVADVGSPKPLVKGIPPKEPRKGPYQLLVKERMMGIYLAVYIHRDLRPLVRGTSRSAVTAGLIGGRVGNKGGIGISVNLDGTTLLFLNAHLAAHEGKVNHRLANLAKIKAELDVDHFLHNDDPRITAEDLTDKFDFTFLCGDLNFRLDISRLHADWLISREDYAQALTFDQLKNLMDNQKAFFGFHEALINFPPTFKYDVLRTLKRAKRQHSKAGRLTPGESKTPMLTEVEERELEELEAQEAVDEAERGEVASVSSTIGTSLRTDRYVEDDDCIQGSLQTPTAIASASKVSIASTAVHKARAKWLLLLSPSTVFSPSKGLKATHGEPWFRKGHNPKSTVELSSIGSPSEERERAVSLQGHGKNVAGLPPMIFVSPVKSSAISDNDDDVDGKGIYDSSHKKRVPSWCDRILWKSTVEPDPEPLNEEDAEIHRNPRNRVTQFFFNAFRPLSGRRRQDSSSSTNSNATVDSSGHPLPSSISAEQTSPDNQYLESCHLIQDRVLQNTRRNSKPSLPRLIPSQGNPCLPQRSSSASSAHSSAQPLSARPIRRATAAPTFESTQEQPHSIVHPRWRFLPSFLSPGPPSINGAPESMLDSSATSPIPRRKGDIVCLSYKTLDDRGMRRLEGRSDHRPVIGSYAVYLS